MHFRVDIVITTNGTAATQVQVTLPFIARNGAGRMPVVGRNVADSTMLIGNIADTGATIVALRKYDGTYPGADGVTLSVNGVYERA